MLVFALGALTALGCFVVFSSDQTTCQTMAKPSVPQSGVVDSNHKPIHSLATSARSRFCTAMPTPRLEALSVDPLALQKETYRGEIGWVGLLERRSSTTKMTHYDLARDSSSELQLTTPQYLRSPVPKGSWEVRLSKEKTVTLDDIAFGYDLWFEENQVFRYITWQGVAVMQDPSDAFAIQDMLYRVKPDLLIELGTNTGGGAFFYSSVMRSYDCDSLVVTLDVVDVVERLKKIGKPGGPNTPSGCESCIFAPDHPYWSDGGILALTGSVTEPHIWQQVDDLVRKAKRVVVVDDANHDYLSTLQNLEAVYRWVTKNSYLLVQDTKMDRFESHATFMNPPTVAKPRRTKKSSGPFWGPMRALDDFLANHSSEFVIDRRFEYFIYSQHHRGFLRRT
jgi:cephalosporin hydroxylase